MDIIVQYGKSNSWVKITYPTSFINYCSVAAIDDSSPTAYGFKCIYNITKSDFYINSRMAGGGTFTVLCHWSAVGF